MELRTPGTPPPREVPGVEAAAGSLTMEDCTADFVGVATEGMPEEPWAVDTPCVAVAVTGQMVV